MQRIKTLFLLIAIFILAACGKGALTPLPFPTPAQHDLVVLVSPRLLTYNADSNGNPSGLEYDLIQAFALELGVGIKTELVEPEQIESRLASNDYHIAAGWLPPHEKNKVVATPPIFMTQDILIQNEASLPLTELSQLSGKTVHVMRGSRQAETLTRLSENIPGLEIVEVKDNLLDLLEKLGNREVDYVAIDDSVEDLASQYIPNLRASLPLSEAQPVVWLLGTHPNVELKRHLDAFIERVQHDGTLARLEERYLGHVKRLTQGDIVKFLGEIETTLPKYRKYFQAAQALTGIDWRLIAAVAYHESHWDPNATSYTNVRGIMMLTEETADRLGVGNRLDPSESVLAGARYIAILKDQLPPEVKEPDRTWLALAAYNIGPGHFGSARALAKQRKTDPNSWYDMKRILPRLAQARGNRARGGEAVILVENIRGYYDILLRNAAPFGPSPSAAEGLKRLVLEVEDKRKQNIRRLAANAKANATASEAASIATPRLSSIESPGSPAPRLPNNEPGR